MSLEEKNGVTCSYYVAIDLGAANVRFVVIKPCKNGGKKDEFSQKILNNTSGSLFKNINFENILLIYMKES